MEYFGEGSLQLTLPQKDIAPEIIITLTEEDGVTLEGYVRVVGYLPKCQTHVTELTLLNGHHVGFAPMMLTENGEGPKSPQYRERCKLIEREMKRWVRRNGNDFKSTPQTKH